MTDKILRISSKLSALPGSIIRVPIIINDGTDITGINFDLKYNNQILELTSPNQNIQKGEITAKNWSIFSNLQTSSNINTLKISASTFQASWGGGGTILTVDFRVKNDASLDSFSVLSIENAGLFSPSFNDINTIIYSGLFTVKESFINSKPNLISPILEQIIQEDNNFVFLIPNNTFVDIDNENLLYSANLSLNNNLTSLPEWLIFDPQNRFFSGTPTNDDVGDYNITVKAIDGQGTFAQTTFTLRVENVNDLPQLINPIPNTNILINNELNYQIATNTFEDIDGDILTYSATLEDNSPLPNWLNFDSQSLTFSGTPSKENLGDITIKLEVNDGNEGISSDTFNLKIIEINSNPIILEKIPAQEAKEDQTFILDLNSNYFSDPDYDNLSYSVSLANDNDMPNWLNFNAENLRFFGIPRNEDVTGEPWKIKVKVNDGNGGEVTDIFELTVNNSNDPPTVVNPIPDQTIEENSLFTFSIPHNTFNDIDGDILTYSVTLNDNSPLPDWLNFNLNTNSLTGTPLQENVGEINLKITSNDGNGGIINDSFKLTIIDVNKPADLLATNFEVISPKVIGGTTEVNFTIKNQGIAESTFFNVDILYSQDVNIDRNDLVIETLNFNSLNINESITQNNVKLTIPRDTLFQNTVNNNRGYLGLIIYDSNNELIDSNVDNNSNQGEGIDLDIITPFPWDINDDNIVTPTDVIYVINRIGQTVNNDNLLADVNGDNSINKFDAITISEHFNN